MKIYLSDMKNIDGRVSYCHKGIRQFFARHGLDWSEFTKNGIDAEQLENTGDAMAIRVVRHAEMKRGRQ